MMIDKEIKRESHFILLLWDETLEEKNRISINVSLRHDFFQSIVQNVNLK